MQIEEAFAVLSLKPNDLLEERFNEILFEAKQFFSSKPIIREVFEHRLNKLDKQRIAFSAIMESEQATKNNTIGNWEPKGQMLDVFNSFYAFRNDVNTSIYQSTSLEEISDYVHVLLLHFDRYLAYWYMPECKSDSTVILGKEADPMELIWALKNLQHLGVYTLAELKEKPDQFPSVLRQEIIRLSAIYKRNTDGRNV